MPDSDSDRRPFTMGDLLQILGFHQGNPFATNEADRERALLPDFFVHVDSYDLIKGNQTVIVFAPRGGGEKFIASSFSQQQRSLEANGRYAGG